MVTEMAKRTFGRRWDCSRQGLNLRPSHYRILGIEVLVRRSNQLSYGSRPNALEADVLIPAQDSQTERSDHFLSGFVYI
ncbi:hypothetical protein HZ326_4767 [Fusarium oxysporum f. sp. albedinis]|nr:hypothetical protein HZ326_4767 [Fusarium oxysporum f. sp. albedinis]